MIISCYAPTNVRFTWNAPLLTVEWDSTAVSHMVRRRTSNGAFTNIGEVYGNTVDVDDLDPGEQYGFYIKSLCGSKESIESYGTFVIPAEGDGATNIRFTTERADEVTIEWDGPSGTYVVRWGENGEYTIVTENEATIPGLDPDKSYTFSVDRYIGSYAILGEESIVKRPFCCPENTVET